MHFRNRIAELLAREIIPAVAGKISSEKSSAAKLSTEKIAGLLAVPPSPELGDYAFPCFILGGNPVQEAEKLQNSLKVPPFLSQVRAEGPYLNFYLNPAAVAEGTLAAIRTDGKNYGAGKAGEKIVIEFCGPNTNKPLHLGHLRNMALGKALCGILAFHGDKVHPVNIVNDRGIHICQSMLAYQKWGKGTTPGKAGKKGDHFVGDYYVRFAQAVKREEEEQEKKELEDKSGRASGRKAKREGKEKDGRKEKEEILESALKKEAQELLLKWERGDKETRALWKIMTKWVLRGFAETYRRFGVAFEKEYFESEYYEKGKELVYRGLKQGVFEKDHTEAIVAPLDKYGIQDKVLLRGDESALYITQDMYLAALRYNDFAFQRMLYVVASEQRLHFRQLFKILELLREPVAGKLHHFSYGMVHLPSGRMKSREGTVIDADDLMDELAALALQEVQKRHPALSSREAVRRAEAIALGALQFFMVRTDAVRDLVFNPEESLSFEGETGPYLQYAHARACSILRKAGELHKGKSAKGKGSRKKSSGEGQDYSLLKEPVEQRLLRHLMGFSEKVEESAMHLKPHLLCRHLLDLAQSFNEFYHSFPVISEEKELMAARLALVDAARQVLANGLGLLGIEALEEM